MRICLYCGYDNPETAAFCGSCGRQLPAGRVCERCGFAESAPHATYCAECGAPLDRARRGRFIWAGGAAALILIVAITLWQTGLLETRTSAEPGQLPAPVATVPEGDPGRAVDETSETPTALTPTGTRSTSTPLLEGAQGGVPSSPSPTVTETPRATSAPTCPGAPLQRVRVGGRARVCTAYDKLIVRQQPGLGSREMTRLEPGTALTVVDGPACANSWSWWKVRVDGGAAGWVSEGGDEVDPYFICPLE